MAILYPKKDLNIDKIKKDVQSKDKFDDKFLENLIFSEEDGTTKYSVAEYKKTFPTDFYTMNKLELRIFKFNHDIQFFSPYISRVCKQRVLSDTECSVWSILNSLVISRKCINFPMLVCKPVDNKYTVYFERATADNIFRGYSNEEMLFQVAFILYYMYKTKIWCDKFQFDVIHVGDIAICFRTGMVAFKLNIKHLVLLSSENVLFQRDASESEYLSQLFFIIRTKSNITFNKDIQTFLEFFLFKYQNKILSSILEPLKYRSNNITTPPISPFHKNGTFVKFILEDKVFTGVIIDRIITDHIKNNLKDCTIAYITDMKNIAYHTCNSSEVYFSDNYSIVSQDYCVGE